MNSLSGTDNDIKKLLIESEFQDSHSVHVHIFRFQKQSATVFLVKGVLKICGKFSGKYACGSVILTKLHCKFIEITILHRCSGQATLPPPSPPPSSNIGELGKSRQNFKKGDEIFWPVKEELRGT